MSDFSKIVSATCKSITHESEEEREVDLCDMLDDELVGLSSIELMNFRCRPTQANQALTLIQIRRRAREENVRIRGLDVDQGNKNSKTLFRKFIQEAITRFSESTEEIL